MRRIVEASVLAALALGCGGCTDYLARRDTLSVGTGEAVAADAALHTIDPWPRHAMRVDPDTDGQRMQRAVERYRNPVSGPNVSVLPPVPVGAPNVPSVTATPAQP